MHHLRHVKGALHVPDPLPFGSSLWTALWVVRQHLWLVFYYDSYGRSHMLTRLHIPCSRQSDTLCLSVCSHIRYRPLRGEATLSPQLHTPPLPATHVWVGNE